MENQTVVEALLNETDEIVDGIGGDVRIEFRFHDIAVFHGNCNDWILCHFIFLSFSEVIATEIRVFDETCVGNGSIIICPRKPCKENKQKPCNLRGSFIQYKQGSVTRWKRRAWSGRKSDIPRSTPVFAMMEREVTIHSSREAAGYDCEQ